MYDVPAACPGRAAAGGRLGTGRRRKYCGQNWHKAAQREWDRAAEAECRA